VPELAPRLQPASPSIAATRTALAAATTRTATRASLASPPTLHAANGTRLVHVQRQCSLWLRFGDAFEAILRLDWHHRTQLCVHGLVGRLSNVGNPAGSLQSARWP
jgi:hypothetical protein